MMNSKHIAIQLFGHLRTFEYTFDSFSKYLVENNKLDNYQVDIFIHTWDELDHSTINYRNLDGKALTNKLLTDELISLVNKLYQPKKIAVESQLDCQNEVLIEKIGKFPRAKKGCLNNSYSIYMANKLRNTYQKEENIDYDWVIVTRPDILFKSPFRIDDIIRCYANFGLEIPNNVIFHGFNPFGRGNMIEDPQFLAGADLIFFGKPEDIDKSSSLYLEFNDNISPENFYCMEVWWADYWKKKGLSPYPINYKHGPDFDVIKTQMLEDKNFNQNSKYKYYKRILFVTLLSLFPYCLVKGKIGKLLKNIKIMKAFYKI
ncbi:hypothetical protein [uncultured Gilliamella sp.]|uniref:DUF7796 domain-containing protein n=1 Tax=uncultured Gilliamella sp. TaxID=1193505 RepID=UPI0025FA4D90|nr:hypothetical protein [uncultured Gilliamella sp.]